MVSYAPDVDFQDAKLNSGGFSLAAVFCPLQSRISCYSPNLSQEIVDP